MIKVHNREGREKIETVRWIFIAGRDAPRRDVNSFAIDQSPRNRMKSAERCSRVNIPEAGLPKRASRQWDFMLDGIFVLSQKFSASRPFIFTASSFLCNIERLKHRAGQSADAGLWEEFTLPYVQTLQSLRRIADPETRHFAESNVEGWKDEFREMPMLSATSRILFEIFLDWHLCHNWSFLPR
jgi:hypothetical protein